LQRAAAPAVAAPAVVLAPAEGPPAALPGWEDAQ
jgi:hypothetical protein